MVLLIVYIGAVAVLFLFVVMMLDINITKLRQSLLNYLPIGILIGSIIFLELFYVVSKSNFIFIEKNIIENISNQAINNTKIIGNSLYTDYFLLFQLSGLILLVAMIGAILLTLRKRLGTSISELLNIAEKETTVAKTMTIYYKTIAAAMQPISSKLTVPKTTAAPTC